MLARAHCRTLWLHPSSCNLLLLASITNIIPPHPQVWPDAGATRFEASAARPVATETPPEQGKDGVTWLTFLPWWVL